MITGNDIRIPIPWVATDPPLRSDVGVRDTELYRRVVDQFEVETNPRYRPRDGKTYCNIFIWDVTRAMNAELPHWVHVDGSPAQAGAPDAQRIDCNALWHWLQENGPPRGWVQTSGEGAEAAVNSGRPTIAIWPNPGSNGHVAMVLPTEGGRPGLVFAQAGSVRFSRGERQAAFKNNVPEYWTHE